jgi:hypothetical protein
VQAIYQGSVEALLQFHTPTTVQYALEENAFIGTMNSEVIRIEDAIIFRGFRKDLKPIVLWDVEDI